MYSPQKHYERRHRSMYNSIQYFTEKIIPKIENK